MEQRLQSILNKHYGKNLDTATDQEVYTALMLYTKEQLAAMSRTEGKRKLYYVSAEFLIGKLLSNNLINLGLFDEAKELLAKHGHELTAVEEAENEPSLGNGGLGRLAACFLDSIATLNLCGDGAGLKEPLDHPGKLAHRYRRAFRCALRRLFAALGDVRRGRARLQRPAQQPAPVRCGDGGRIYHRRWHLL